MNAKLIIENNLVEDASGVLLLEDHREFGYSDGSESERYLNDVLRNASDLSSTSSELTSHIKDWPSEYHLTVKRAQLLSGFTFDRSLRVIEVGCGCGAITRILGERFDSVVSVEGSLARARLARLRTRDLASVNVVCAPFQKIRFKKKFDVVFCIGVFEYSASFVDAPNPYEAVLDYFADLLSPDGIVVIAIENQFGLKYFNGYNEDHVGQPFEGLEGYHRRPLEVRTFGKRELIDLLKPRFPVVSCYYPYPDYKLPDAVLSGPFLASGRAGDLIYGMRSRDYSSERRPLWDEGAASLELSRNGLLEDLAHSFLLVAGRGAPKGVRFDQQCIVYSSSRKSTFATQTRIIENGDGSLRVEKRLRSGAGEAQEGPLRLVACDETWVDGLSLQTTLALRALSHEASLVEIFAPAKAWADRLAKDCDLRSGRCCLSGAHVDSIWGNAYVTDAGCVLIDHEWIWHEEIPFNVLVIRAIYDFLSKLAESDVNAALRARSGRKLIEAIASAVGVELEKEDFEAFIDLEAEIGWRAFGIDRNKQISYLRWYLTDRPTLQRARRTKQKAKRLVTRIRSRLTRR